MKPTRILGTAAVMLWLACNVVSGQDLKPVDVTASEPDHSWQGCSLTVAGGQAYAVSGKGVWRLNAGKAERVKTQDGASFVPAGAMMGSNEKFMPVAGALMVPGPHQSDNVREQLFGAAWIVRDGVARPVLKADGTPLVYQRLGPVRGENNPVMHIFGDSAPQFWLIKGETASHVETPKEAHGASCFMLDGRPALSYGMSGSNLWILDKDKWARLTDRAGQPLNVATGTYMGSPDGRVMSVGSILGILDATPGKTQTLLFNVKGTTAEPIKLPEGVVTHYLFRLGKTTVLSASDNNQPVLLSLDGGKPGTLKGAPKGNVALFSVGDAGLASLFDAKSQTSRYYRMDDKGAKEIKLPKGWEKAPMMAQGAAGRTLFVVSTLNEGGTLRRGYWRVDEKGALTPLDLGVAQDADPREMETWLCASDGAYLHKRDGEQGPRFVPAT